MLKHKENKVNVTCSLPDLLYKELMIQAFVQKVDIHFMVEWAIQQFQADYDDLRFFMYGGKRKLTGVELMTGIIKGKQEQSFHTFQIDVKAFKRIIDYKESYKVSKSIVIQRFISKYFKLKEAA